MKSTKKREHELTDECWCKPKRVKANNGDLKKGGTVKRSIVKKAFDVLRHNDSVDYANMLTRVDELAVGVSDWTPGMRKAYRYLTTVLRRKSGMVK